MNVNVLSNNDRETLLTTFRQFRANYGEQDGEDYSNHDALEGKLQNGGELDDLDLHILRTAIWNELTDQDTIDALLIALGEDK